ncbi:MAG: hypothetical protein NZ484_01025 [Patescibacteria group bacterium]|nr:hypothetical protein [Patescibacteria group bacterium]MCX7589519.1 hypothetical protein [Patescibacteria group bacterium]MDW8279941.1 hypothetical protein [bacterium]
MSPKQKRENLKTRKRWKSLPRELREEIKNNGWHPRDKRGQTKPNGNGVK